MKSIAYVVPYFGKLPKNFQFWLLTCSQNPSVNWIIFTDDRREFNVPSNVKIIYTSFEEIKERFQSNFEFKILIDRPWKLCDFKVTYGEVFSQELKNYDFWGYCDLDLAWGDIRRFITDDILEKYEKIGFQGHSTLYKNTAEVNSRYKIEIQGMPTYKEILSNSKGYAFDENIICNMYKKLNIPYYSKTNFAHLSKYDYGFVLRHLPPEDEYKNKRQVFIWDKGKIHRKYVNNHIINTEEFMYIHFSCRPITYKLKHYDKNIKYVMYADVVEELKQPINYEYINKKGKPAKIKYYVKSLYYNRKKLAIRNIIKNIKNAMKYKRQRREFKV